MYCFLTKLLCNNRTNSDQGISNGVRRRQTFSVMFCYGVCLEGESKVDRMLNNALLYDGRRMDKSRYSSTQP